VQLKKILKDNEGMNSRDIDIAMCLLGESYFAISDYESAKKILSQVKSYTYPKIRAKITQLYIKKIEGEFFDDDLIRIQDFMKTDAKFGNLFENSIVFRDSKLYQY
jgi:hypothetical protein